MRRRPVDTDGGNPSSKGQGAEGITGTVAGSSQPPNSDRPTSLKQPANHHSSMQASREDRRLESIIESVADKSPPWLAKILRAFAPFVTVTFIILNAVGPIFISFYGFLYKAYKVLPVNVLGMLYGLIICFFGGFFHITIAAIEAFNMTGGDKVWICIAELKADLEAVHMANKEDDKRDDDNDGVPDVQQITAEKLVTRKVALGLRVVNPDRVTNAVTGIWQGYMGVLVILKFRFAKVIALAVSIGNNMRPIVAKVFGPSLAFIIPKEYHQWIAPLINYFCKFVAMTIAWWIQRFISTVQSAIRGGLLFARSLMSVIGEKTNIKLDPDDSFIDEIIGWTLAACGAYFQISHNWDLPWFIDLFLWPAYMLELFLKWSVTWMDASPAAP